jgi:hypothetical protein
MRRPLSVLLLAVALFGNVLATVGHSQTPSTARSAAAPNTSAH